MQTPCSGTSTTTYKSGHNPAFWYDNLRRPTNTCGLYDVPMSPALDADLDADTLPTVAWITPNRCNIFEWNRGCPGTEAGRFARGDRWLAALLPRLTALPSYQAGRTLIVVTWDEGHAPGMTNRVDCTNPAYYPRHPDCQIPTVVVSPYIVPGTSDARDLNLYGLLGTVQDLFGLPRLGRAVGQTSLRSGLGF
jgi:phosphatidylinositol-3-phosphatase